MGDSGRTIGTVIGATAGFFVAGPAGAAAGAAIGGQLGGSIDQENQAREAANRAQDEMRSATRGEDEFIKRARELSERRRQELESAPSVAEQATKMGIEQATRQSIAQATAQRGISPGLAAAIAARQNAMLGVDAIARGAVAQAEERLNRQQQIATSELAYEDMVKQLLGARRGTALGMSQIAAEQQMAANKNMTNMVSSIGNALITAGMNEGGIVPGKAKVKGDSEKNDTVHALLSPGEMVIPRSVVKKGPEAIKSFAEKLLEKEG
jgi:hypothetical protein